MSRYRHKGRCDACWEKLPEDGVSRDRAPDSSRRGCLVGQVSGHELFPGLAGVRCAESVTSVSHCRYFVPVETDSQKVISDM